MFTLEMSKTEVTQRLMCSEAKVESQRLRTGKLAPDDWPRLTAACDKLAKAPIYVDDTGSINMMEIRSKSRRLKSREPDLGLIVVDYLQLMSSAGNAENRVQEVSQISRSLKILARDLDTPILALSQLSRAVEQRTDKRPILSDLRESGCLAGDSRVYLPDEGVYRPIRELEGRSGFRVLAVDTETWRLEPRVVTRAFATGRKPVYTLRTRLGREIRATANHKFLAFDGWRRLDDLAPGMRLAVPRTLVGPETQTMSDSELALLGHLIGDGCTLPRHAIQYTTKDRDLAGLVANLADEVFGDAVAPRIKAERTWYQVYLPATAHLTHGVRNPVAAWLDELGAFGLRSWEKRVPSACSSRALGIAMFLRHLWATDGCSGRDRLQLSRDPVRLEQRAAQSRRRLTAPSSRNHGAHHEVLMPGRDARAGGSTSRARTTRTRSCRQSEVSASSARPGERDRRPTCCSPRKHEPRRPAERSMGDDGSSRRWRQRASPRAHCTPRLGNAYCGSTLYRSGLSRERAARVADIVDSEELRQPRGERRLLGSRRIDRARRRGRRFTT